MSYKKINMNTNTFQKLITKADKVFLNKNEDELKYKSKIKNNGRQ